MSYVKRHRPGQNRNSFIACHRSRS